MFCPKCGQANDDTAGFCLSCGAALPVYDPAAHSAPINNAAPVEPVEFYRAIVGPKHQDYYVRAFTRFDSKGKAGPSWNWPAFFVTFYWLLYRKMWRHALIYFLLPYVVMIPLGMAAAALGHSAEAVIGLAYIAYLIAILILPPMYANALYYKHCKQRIAETQASTSEVQRQLGELSGKGGTSNAALIIVLVFVFVAIFGILAAIAIPQYQEYTTRARMSEAAAIGNSAASTVENYYSQHQQVPTSLAQTGFAAQLPQSIRAVELIGDNGVVAVTMAPPVEGKMLLLIPSIDDKDAITWRCLSKEIPERFLPRQCRRQ